MVLMLVVGILASAGLAGSIAAARRDTRRPVPTDSGYDTRHPLP